MSDVLSDLWKKELAPILAPLWDNLAFWRATGLISISVLVLAFLFRDWLSAFVRIEKYHEHDTKIFRAETIDGDTIRYFIDTLNHKWETDLQTLRMVKLGVKNSVLPESQYRHWWLARRHARFILNLMKLLDFLDDKFVEHNGFYLLNYDLNISEDATDAVMPKTKAEKHHLQEMTEELHRLAISTLKSYDQFRTAIKEKLLI